MAEGAGEPCTPAAGPSGASPRGAQVLPEPPEQLRAPMLPRLVQLLQPGALPELQPGQTPQPKPPSKPTLEHPKLPRASPSQLQPLLPELPLPGQALPSPAQEP